MVKKSSDYLCSQDEFKAVKSIVEKLIEDLEAQYKEHPRRKPVRFTRIWRILEERKNKLVALDELEALFKTKNPRKDAINTVSQLNKHLSDSGFVFKRVTAYRIEPDSEE